MPLQFDVSHFTGPKIQSLQADNLRLQEKIRDLEMKNASLTLRLTESHNDTHCLREDLIHFRLQTEKESNCRCQLTANVQETSVRLKDIKSDLKSLETDVGFMFSDARKLFDDHLTELMNRLEKVKVKDGNITELDKRVVELENALKEANDRYSKEKKRRRKLHNTLIELRGNIRVHCRLRPLLEFDNRTDSSFEEIDERDTAVSYGNELGKAGTPSEQMIHPLDDENILVHQSKPGSYPKHFEFEHVFFPGDTQEVIFDEVQPLITSLLDGYNVCIMAYGQTGSGKTHTMLGTKEEPGIVPRAGDDLFKLVDEKPAGSASVQVSVTEVYNNEIYDLLSDNPKDTKHEITSTEEGGLDTASTIQIQVHSSADIEKWMEHGLRHRAMIATKVHEHSSRSHLVVTLTVTNHKTVVESPRKLSSHLQQTDVLGSPITPPKRRQLPKPNASNMTKSMTSSRSSFDAGKSGSLASLGGDSYKTKLQLVDLAGSECVGMSGVTGSALRETSHINKSLSALSDVLCALSEKRSHIPYRNSRLTRLLQDSIGGDAKLLLMLCVSPAQRYLTESTQCLSFGERARQVQRGPPKKRGYQIVDSPARPPPQSPRESVRKLRL